MNETKLGALTDEKAERDAIHVAVAPVVSAELLKPGQHIGIIDKDCAGVCSTPIGIVDPFLTRSVKPGERFFMVLYPGTITSLKHHWTHPSFAAIENGAVNESKRWLEALADDCEMSYNALLRQIPSGSIHTGDHEMYGARSSEDIAHHYFVVTGVKVEGHIRFSCAC